MTLNVLITGGAGFIGSTLCDRLILAGHNVTILDNFVSGDRRNLEYSTRVAVRGQLRVVEADVRSILEIQAQIGKVDVVFHLAALISGYDSLNDASSYVDVNINGLVRILEFVKMRGIKRLVFASSSTVYGNSAAETLVEESLPSPLTVYAATKLAGEHLIALFAKLNNFTHCSLRLFNVYGPRQAVDHPYANVTCKFSFAAAHGNAIIRYGDGEQSRDFIFVDDVADAFMAVLLDSSKSIYNVGTGRENSVNTLIRSLEAITGRNIEIISMPEWPNDIKKIRADNSRIALEFGLVKYTELAVGLQKTVEYFKGGGANNTPEYTAGK